MASKKLAETVRKMNLHAPADWLQEIDVWRKTQDPMPNVSEAIRQLVRLGIKAEASAKPKKARP
jgi:Arc/MetJ-type ribon-helix-helix transcriptional regulator